MYRDPFRHVNIFSRRSLSPRVTDTSRRRDDTLKSSDSPETKSLKRIFTSDLVEIPEQTLFCTTKGVSM